MNELSKLNFLHRLHCCIVHKVITLLNINFFVIVTWVSAVYRSLPDILSEECFVVKAC
jgi:hypothetical protein